MLIVDFLFNIREFFRTMNSREKNLMTMSNVFRHAHVK